MDERDPRELSDRLEKEADQLKRRSEETADQIDDVRQEWKAKQADHGVPGADPPDGDEDASREA